MRAGEQWPREYLVTWGLTLYLLPSLNDPQATQHGAWQVPSAALDSPERDLDTEVAVDSNCQHGQDRYKHVYTDVSKSKSVMGSVSLENLD